MLNPHRDKNWRIIEIAKVIPIVDLLPKDKREKVYELAPRPLLGRWILGNQLDGVCPFDRQDTLFSIAIAIHCRDFTAYQPILTEEDIKEGWYSLGQSVNPSIALIVKHAAGFEGLLQPISGTTHQSYQWWHDPNKSAESGEPGEPVNATTILHAVHLTSCSIQLRYTTRIHVIHDSGPLDRSLAKVVLNRWHRMYCTTRIHHSEPLDCSSAKVVLNR